MAKWKTSQCLRLKDLPLQGEYVGRSNMTDTEQGDICTSPAVLGMLSSPHNRITAYLFSHQMFSLIYFCQLLYGTVEKARVLYDLN